MSRNFRNGQLQAILDQARARGLVVEEKPVHKATPPPAPEASAEGKPLRRRQKQNKTEALYGRLLEAQKNRGEVLRYEFEAMAFRWGGTETTVPVLYSPDWVVVLPSGRIRLVEVKGGLVRYGDRLRFKGCRAAWPEFEWEMHQYAKGEWHRIE